MPWYFYFGFVKNEFCQIETFGWPIMFLASYQQFKGTFTPQSAMGYRPRIKGEQESSPLARYPFLMTYALVTIIALSLVDHKEQRFYAPVVMIGHICQALQTTFVWNAYLVILNLMKVVGKARRRVYDGFKTLFFAHAVLYTHYVCFKCEQSRQLKYLMISAYSYDTGHDSYSTFFGRSSLVPDEQPHSVYFLNKFTQPMHLMLHSHPWDYPETARKENITSPADW